MSVLVPTLISAMQQYGYPILWLSVFIAAVGVPLPVNLVLLALGAFAALGDFNIVLLGIIATTAAISGDSAGYFLGRWGGKRVLDWLEQKQRVPLLSPKTITRSRSYFTKHGGWAIFLSRFLFSALGGTTNLLAGADLYPYKRFLLLDACGEIVGMLIPISLGFLFGESWEAIGDVLSAVSLFSVALLLVLYFTYRLIKMLQRSHMVNADSQDAKTGSIVEVTQTKTDLLPL